MEACISSAFEFCRVQGINKVIIFTGTGDGAMFAVDTFLTRQEFSSIQMVAVTPPAGKLYRSMPGDDKSEIVSAGVPSARKDFLREMGVPVVSAHMPFKVANGSSQPAWSDVAEAFGVLGGGFSLCVQSILMACDAGEVEIGERVVAASADTAMAAIASRTELFKSAQHGLLVEHIVCRPRRFDLSKRGHSSVASMGRFQVSMESSREEESVFIDVPPQIEEPQRLILGPSDSDAEDD